MIKSLVVITGASRGIGKALALQFAKNDYPLLLISRDMPTFSELEGKKVVFSSVDVTDYKQLGVAFREAENRHGPIQILINNAGISRRGTFVSHSHDHFKKMIDINITGVLNASQIALEGMEERKQGTIINIGSTSGRKVRGDNTVYSATKHAVHAISDSLRMGGSAQCANHDNRSRVCRYTHLGIDGVTRTGTQKPQRKSALYQA